jgi:hypothetical protein
VGPLARQLGFVECLAAGSNRKQRKFYSVRAAPDGRIPAVCYTANDRHGVPTVFTAQARTANCDCRLQPTNVTEVGELSANSPAMARQVHSKISQFLVIRCQ